MADTRADTPKFASLAARAQIVSALVEPSLEPSVERVPALDFSAENDALVREVRMMSRGSRSATKGELSKARGIARDLTRKFPASASGETLRGDVFERQGKHRAALAAFENACRLNPSPGLLKRIVAGWRALGQPERAEQLLNARVQRAPNDLTARSLLGDLLLAHGRLDEAREHYDALLHEQPTNASALNNLAWIYYRQGDARALRIAEDAYRLAGTRGAVADTYGWLLVEVGQARKGRKILEQAYEQAPEDAYLRYHLAVAMVRTEARSEARKLLTALRADNPNFADREAVLSLLAKLGPAQKDKVGDHTR